MHEMDIRFLLTEALHLSILSEAGLVCKDCVCVCVGVVIMCGFICMHMLYQCECVCVLV